MSFVFIDNIIGFFKDPIGTFQKQKDSTILDASLYFIILFVIYSVLGGVVSMFFMSVTPTPVIPVFGGNIPGINPMVTLILITIVLMLIFIIIGAIILHFIARILGGKKGINESFKAVFYSGTPFFLLGWIPMVSFVFMLWSLALGIIGIRELQEISVGKSILAVIIALAITYLFLGVVISGLIFSTFKPGLI